MLPVFSRIIREGTTLSEKIFGLAASGAQPLRQDQDRPVATKSGNLLSSKLDAKLTPRWLWIIRLQSTNGLSGNLD